MDNRPSRNQDSSNFQKDWQAVSRFLVRAMEEVALELGGEEMAKEIRLVVASDGVLPNPDGLKLLEDLLPGSAERVLVRASEIQHEDYQHQLERARESYLREYGKAILKGFTSFNIFGNR